MHCNSQKKMLDTEQGHKAEFDRVNATLTAINACTLVSITDLDGRIIEVNSQFSELYGYSQFELIGQQHNTLGGDLHSQQVHSDLLKTIKLGKVWSGELCNRAKSGNLIWIKCSASPVIGIDGHITHFLSASYDITEQKQYESQLLETSLQLKTLLLMSSDWYWEQDENLKFKVISEGFGSTGESPEAYLGRHRWKNLSSGDELLWEEHRRDLEARRPFKDFKYRVTSDTDPDKFIWFCTTGEPIFNPKGDFTGYRGIARDISVHHSNQDQIWELANLDALTSLPNRVSIAKALDSSVGADKEPFALLVIGLDEFKALNDAMGVGAGDVLLRVMASRIKGTLRHNDFVGRLGGDEFAVIIRGVGTAIDAHCPLESMMMAIQAPVTVLDNAYCTASIGVTIYPTDARSGADLIKNAGIAMNTAKSNGRSQSVMYSRGMKHIVERQAVLLKEMELAFDASQLKLHYQPIVNPGTRKVLSFEALLRWDHPRSGLIAAGSFHQALENMSVSARIGRLVSNLAVKQASLWQEQGVLFNKIAINVTAADFILGGLPSYLEAILSKYEVDSSHVCVEVTEGMFLGPSAKAIINGLHELHAMGVEIAFDDFGTGYASLTHLKLPIDRLKIDRSFVTNIESDSINSAIVKAVIDLGKQLDMEVTAEGVETTDQQNILLKLGCEQFQGHLYSKALHPNEVPGFIEAFVSSRSSRQTSTFKFTNSPHQASSSRPNI